LFGWGAPGADRHGARLTRLPPRGTVACLGKTLPRVAGGHRQGGTFFESRKPRDTREADGTLQIRQDGYPIYRSLSRAKAGTDGPRGFPPPKLFLERAAKSAARPFSRGRHRQSRADPAQPGLNQG